MPNAYAYIEAITLIVDTYTCDSSREIEI